MSGMPVTPSDRFGPLFEAVQAARIFSDSKTFPDAVARAAPDVVLAAWRAANPRGAAELRTFVAAHFDLPGCLAADESDGLPLAEHVEALWSRLTRSLAAVSDQDSALSLPRPFVVPGGRFRELYYWDSYFTMLGLARSGRQDLVEDMIADFGSLIDRFGHIPNGTRSYYLSRSHPPVFYLAAGLSRDRSREGRLRRLGWMRAEHRFWMAGEEWLAPGGRHRRLARMADGALLNRYWDDRPQPRDESWVEDMAVAATATGRNPAELWRDLRAAAESGWDFSSRWLGEGTTLAAIRTTRIIPVDLNSLLHGLEVAIAVEAEALDEPDADACRARAERRRQAIETYLWNEGQGFYADHDLDRGAVSDQPTAAMAFPLFARVASDARAAHTASALHHLLRPWGLATTAKTSGEQWDAPNGWAPLQWIAYRGLRHYGADELAADLAGRWLRLVEAQYRATGQIFEKYDVENGTAGGGGEYPVETGFGWTNGVWLALRDEEAVKTRPGQAPADFAPNYACPRQS